jgi:hypothetical protein
MRGGVRADSFGGDGQSVWTPDSGWSFSRSRMKYGGAWPWHNGRVNVVNIETSAHSLSIRTLLSGCEARPNWSGAITDTDAYIWDLR